jgi:hypothetical protein
VEYAEGVVTGLQAVDGRTAPDARIVILIDRWRNWDSHAATLAERAPPATSAAARRAEIAATRAEAAARTAEAQAARDTSANGNRAPRTRRTSSLAPFPDDRPQEMSMILTRRSHLYNIYRTIDGVDLYATPAPGTAFAGGALGNGAANIPLGAFVTVRYRRIGDNNVVLNLSMISLLPANSRTSAVAPRVPGLIPSRGSVPPAYTRPLADPTLNPPLGPAANPLRVPRVPNQPSSPGDLPQ